MVFKTRFCSPFGVSLRHIFILCLEWKKLFFFVLSVLLLTCCFNHRATTVQGHLPLACDLPCRPREDVLVTLSWSVIQSVLVCRADRAVVSLR